MKYLKFIFGFVIVLFLYACNTTNISVDKALTKLIETIPFEVDSDLNIPKTYTFEEVTYNVSYTSADLDVIGADGKVYRSFEEVATSINVVISKDEHKASEEVEVIVKKLSQDDVKDIITSTVAIETTVTKDLNLPTKLEHHIYEATLTWTSSNQNVVTNEGKVNFKNTKQSATLSVEFSYNNTTYNYTNLYALEIEAVPEDEFLEFTANNFSLPATTNLKVNLPSNINGVSILWTSSHPSLISIYGDFNHPDVDTEVEITAKFFYKGKTVDKTYKIVALTVPHEERFNLALSKISFPEVITSNLNLQTKFEYNVTGEWFSNKPSVISNTGLLYLSTTEQTVTLTLKLTSGEETMEKEFNLKTGKIAEGETFVNSHHYLGYAQEFNASGFTNLKLEEGLLVLEDSKLTGTYESPVFKTSNFTTLVGSWAAVTDTNTTAELKVRVRVNGTWSNYLSYGAFGLGLENKMIDQNGGVARLSQDEVMINNSQQADAFQYQVVLKRNKVTDTSAKLSLVSVALDIPNYSFSVDISNLPKKVEHDLPNLYQIDVPTIGSIICSPTSATMLLMYRGHEFTDELPHREVSPLLREYNTGIYGNWVYNTVGMSAFGENTYVKRIYSFEELVHHLATVGPVALSIKGNTGRYTTAGHLLVVSGYEITDSGRSILVHDPNLPEVEWKYSEAIYNGFTRNVIYVVENN